MSTLKTKGHDYTDSDALENFKLIRGVDPAEVALIQLSIKLNRLTNLLLRNKTPKNESIDDNIKDLANYAVLLAMILIEKRAQQEKE